MKYLTLESCRIDGNWRIVVVLFSFPQFGQNNSKSCCQQINSNEINQSKQINSQFTFNESSVHGRRRRVDVIGVIVGDDVLEDGASVAQALQNRIHKTLDAKSKTLDNYFSEINDIQCTVLPILRSPTRPALSLDKVFGCWICWLRDLAGPS